MPAMAHLKNFYSGCDQLVQKQLCAELDSELEAALLELGMVWDEWGW
jgi:hypothetical protein